MPYSLLSRRLLHHGQSLSIARGTFLGRSSLMPPMSTIPSISPLTALVFSPTTVRNFATQGRKSAQQAYQEETRMRNRRVGIYMLAVVVVTLGISYAAVPLYKVFCQATGFGGTTQQVTMEKAKKMMPVPGSQPITIQFSGTTSDTLAWDFKPQQRQVKVVPGETALAFYTAHNPTDKPITGVATYNVTPSKAGIYFNKIQCFCFDEQRLKPNEEVDMPIFFYIDPEFAEDPQMHNVNNICLSYVFFKARDQEDE